MPVVVRRRYKNEKGKPWKIVEKANRRKVVGESTTKKKAQASANARNAARHGWKPTRRRSRR